MVDFSVGSEAADVLVDKAQQILLTKQDDSGESDGGSGENGNANVQLGAVAAVSEFFDEQSARRSDNEKIELVILEMSVFNEASYPEAVLAAAKKLSDEQIAGMSSEQAAAFYVMLMAAYYNTGDVEAGNRYYDLFTELKTVDLNSDEEY